MKVEVLGLVDAVPGNVHHAVRERCSDEYADACNKQDGLEGGRLGTYRRIEEVNRIVTHTDDQVEYG